MDLSQCYQLPDLLRIQLYKQMWEFLHLIGTLRERSRFLHCRNISHISLRTK